MELAVLAALSAGWRLRRRLCTVSSKPITHAFCFFFFNDTATTEIYTPSLHAALPISTITPLVTLGLGPGSAFEYVFDLGDRWRHHCEVRATDLDPAEEYGDSPDRPVPIWGWGWIPDQYGRINEDE